jgi:outer membrane protein assembly factor BamB
LAVLLFITASVSYAQTSQGQSTKISWNKQPGVTTYRLQIATDEQFQDVLVDRLIDGYEYIISDLDPGLYHWRVAAKNGSRTGQFLKAGLFEVKKVPVVAKPPIIVSKPTPTPAVLDDSKTRTRLTTLGWSVTTGEIVRLMAAQLRAGATPDFVGVNAEGTVYALDSARGFALWTARFNLTPSPDERVRVHYNQFVPMLLSNPATGTRLLVAFDKGVRALDGATGREIWNTKIAGIPSAATLIGSDIYLVAEKADKLLILDGSTGQLKRQIKLKAEAIGPPVVLSSGVQSQLLVPLRGALIELCGLDGTYIRSFRMGTELTTQPIVVQARRGPLLLMGLKNGLIAFDAATVEALGRIAIEGNDYPVGSLSVVDLDGDKLQEVVMTTNAGRVLAIDVGDGKIRWQMDVGAVSLPAFADLDGDTLPDVLVPGKNSLAVGLSGSTGSLIWDSGEETTLAKSPASARSVAVAKVNDGRLIVVGNDRTATGLRALEVPKASAKSNQ